jgi:hypothetical protein
MRKKETKVGISILILLIVMLLNTKVTHANVVFNPSLPVTTCGEMAAPGTYTLTTDITTAASSTCFVVSSDSVIIDGAGHTVTSSGAGSIAVDARAWNMDGSNTLAAGSNAYSKLTVYNIIFTGFDTGVIARGNDDTTGLGINGGGGGGGR